MQYPYQGASCASGRTNLRVWTTLQAVSQSTLHLKGATPEQRLQLQRPLLQLGVARGECIMQHYLRLLCELAAVLGAQLGEGHNQVAPHSVASTLQARSAPACASCISDEAASTVNHKSMSQHQTDSAAFRLGRTLMRSSA